MSWPSVKLAEVATVNPRLPKDVDETQEVSFVAMASASEEGRLLSEEIRVLSKTRKGFTYFEKEDVLLAKITPCFENGKCLRPSQITSQIGFGSTEFHVLRADPKKLDSQYLFYMVWSDKFRLLGESSMSGAAGQKRVSTDFLKNFEIPLPPLTEQKRIAAILDKADAIRRKRQQAIQLADEFLRSVFLDMFGDPVTNPKGWETKTIEQLISPEKYALKRGPFGGALKKEIFVEDGYLVYEQYHALNGDFSYQRYFIDEGKYEELKAFNVKPKDIIVSCSGVNLGRLAEVPDCAPRGIINQALMKITLNQELIANKLFIDIFSNPSFKKAFYGDFRGAAIPNFPPMSTFKEFEFIVPPIDLQNKYISIREKLLVHSAYSEEMDSLKLFEALSQKAFSGCL